MQRRHTCVKLPARRESLGLPHTCVNLPRPSLVQVSAQRWTIHPLMEQLKDKVRGGGGQW